MLYFLLFHVGEISEEAFDYMVDVNYRGLYFSIKCALNQMAEKSSIILIASCAAHITRNTIVFILQPKLQSLNSLKI